MRAAAYTVYKFGAELFGVSDVSSLALLYYHNYLTRRDLYYTGVYHRDNWKQLKILNDHIVKGAEL
jgi:hypothetical protein